MFDPRNRNLIPPGAAETVVPVVIGFAVALIIGFLIGFGCGLAYR